MKKIRYLKYKKFLPDIFFLIICLSFAFLFSKIFSPKVEKIPTFLKIKKSKNKIENKIILKNTYSEKFLKTRNIFSLNGKYISSSLIKTNNSKIYYTLIGVLQGEKKKAVLKDSNGNIYFLEKGDKLLNGFVITKIKINSIELKKNNKKIELKIFKIKKSFKD